MIKLSICFERFRVIINFNMKTDHKHFSCISINVLNSLKYSSHYQLSHDKTKMPIFIEHLKGGQLDTGTDLCWKMKLIALFLFKIF